MKGEKICKPKRLYERRKMMFKKRLFTKKQTVFEVVKATAVTGGVAVIANPASIPK